MNTKVTLLRGNLAEMSLYGCGFALFPIMASTYYFFIEKIAYSISLKIKSVIYVGISSKT